MLLVNIGKYRETIDTVSLRRDMIKVSELVTVSRFIFSSSFFPTTELRAILEIERSRGPGGCGFGGRDGSSGNLWRADR